MLALDHDPARGLEFRNIPMFMPNHYLNGEPDVRPDHVDDTFLVREALRGNEQAFEELVHRHDRAVLRLALRLTGSKTDAQDIYQETFLRVHRKLDGFRFEASFSTWIYRIVSNLCLEHLRKKQRRKEDDFVTLSAKDEDYDLSNKIAAGRSHNPETGLARRELAFRINRALQRLTPRERVVFELKHYHGLKLRIIGNVLDASEQAVKTSLFRATRKMRSALVDVR